MYSNKMSLTEKPVLDELSRCLFMEVYKKHFVLWNKNHPHYKNFGVRTKAYQSIAEIMQIDGLTPDRVIKNIHNMRSTYVKMKKQGLLTIENLPNCKQWLVIANTFLGDPSSPLDAGPEDGAADETDYFSPAKKPKPSSSPADIVFNNEMRIRLLEAYQEREALWNPNHQQYRHTFFRDKAWNECAEKLGISAVRCRKQMHNLRTTYVKKRKQLQPDSNMSFSTDMNTNHWLMLMDSFLGAVLFQSDVHGESRLLMRKERINVKPPVTDSICEDSDNYELEDNVQEETIIADYLDELIAPEQQDGNDDAEDAISQQLQPETAKESIAPVQLTTCRCCLKENDVDDVKVIHRTFRDGVVYTQIYKDCIGFNHSDSDYSLPATICLECEHILLDLYEFRKLCRNNEEEYLASLAKVKKEERTQPQPIFDLKIELLDNIEILEDKFVFEDQTASDGERPDEFDEDMMYVEQIEEVEPTPDIEGKLELEEEQVEEERLQNVEQPVVVKMEKMYGCSLCDKRFVNEQFLNYHIKYIHDGAGKTQDEEKKVVRHLKKTTATTSTDNQGHICPYCASSFKEIRYMKRHIKFTCTKHPDYDRAQLPICPICGKQVSRLSVHMQTHRQPTEAERFRCKLCDRSYKQKIYLDGHMKYSHENHTYDCSFCHMTFKSWSGKRNHIRLKHFGVRPFACDMPGCGRSFTQLGQLNYHRRQVHFTEQKQMFKCDQCSAQFTKKETLKVHKESKHSNQTVACNVCKKVFAHKKMLRQHSILHTGEKNYVCPVCSHAFAQCHVLRTHVAKLHPDYQLPPKGTVMSARALERMARQQELDKTFVKIDIENVEQVYGPP